MKENQKKIAGYVFFGLAAVALVLIIVGLCVPNVVGEVTVLGQSTKYSYTLFDDKWEAATKMYNASPTVSIIGFVIAIVGAAALVTYFVLKLFLNKNIKIIGLLAAIVTLVGGIVAFVGAAIVAGKLNTGNGTIGNLQIYDPAVGAILGLVGGVLAVIAGGLATSKKFN